MASRHVMKTLDGRRATVPVHGNQTLPIGTPDGIITEAGITVEESTPVLREKKP